MGGNAMSGWPFVVGYAAIVVPGLIACYVLNEKRIKRLEPMYKKRDETLAEMRRRYTCHPKLIEVLKSTEHELSLRYERDRDNDGELITMSRQSMHSVLKQIRAALAAAKGGQK